MMHFRWPVRWKPRSHHYPLREASRGEGRLGHSTRDGASPIDHREYNSRTRLFPVLRLLEPEAKVPTVEGVDRPTLTRMIYRSQAVPFEWVPVNGREGGW